MKDWLIVAMCGVGLLFVSIGATTHERERITNQCRAIGAFESDGEVFKCKPKTK